MSEPFIGQIVQFGGNFAPRSWAKCDGQLLQIASFSALFSILGTTYGGDGRTTFALPDFRGRVSMNWGQGPGLPNYVIGQKGGTDSVTLNTSQVPPTPLQATTDVGDQAAPAAGRHLAAVSNNTAFPPAPEAKIYSNSTANLVNLGGATGGGQGHENRQPFLCVTWIIALQGTFPSRN